MKRRKRTHAKRVASFTNSSEESFTSFNATGVPFPSQRKGKNKNENQLSNQRNQGRKE
jgi:hypothetical protein